MYRSTRGGRRSGYRTGGGGRGSGGFKRSPVNVGDVVDVEIVELSRRGDGIARIRGFIIFVPNTKPGDRVKVRIKRIGRNYAVAELASGEGEETLE
ncbi:MAG: TRAM domain-containing protein [Crenarchaeota archaeon]|nr:TRAM domain-containing protein [Thermoproteota archaeon]